MNSVLAEPIHKLRLWALSEQSGLEQVWEDFTLEKYEPDQPWGKQTYLSSIYYIHDIMPSIVNVFIYTGT